MNCFRSGPPNWLLWFGLIFVAFVMYSPGGLVGIWDTLARRWWPAREEAAAMSKRRIYQGLPLPGFLLPEGLKGAVLEVKGISKTFWRHPRRIRRKPPDRRRRDPCPDRSERRRKDDAVQPDIGPVPRPTPGPFVSTAATFRACRPT